jgi:hypothetical protein
MKLTKKEGKMSTLKEIRNKFSRPKYENEEGPVSLKTTTIISEFPEKEIEKLLTVSARFIQIFRQTQFFDTKDIGYLKEIHDFLEALIKALNKVLFICIDCEREETAKKIRKCIDSLRYYKLVTIKYFDLKDIQGETKNTFLKEEDLHWLLTTSIQNLQKTKEDIFKGFLFGDNFIKDGDK